MRRTWLIPPLMLLAPFVYGGASGAGLEGDPSLFQAGNVHAGAALSHRFALVNKGAEAAEIVEVRPSCGCVTATPDRRQFAPGEAGSLLLGVNTLTQPDGLTSWGVTLRCRCGDRIEDAALTLTATVQADIKLEPAALVIESEGAVSRTVALTDRRQSSMAVTVETTHPRIMAQVCDFPIRPMTIIGTARAVGPWTYTIHLEAPADLPDGRYDETLHVYTSDPEYPDLKMPFTLIKRARRRVTATPAAAELTAGSPSRLVLLRGGDGDEVQIEGADCDSPALRCEWAPDARPTAALRVRIDAAKLPPDGLKTTIHIHLGKPVAQTVDVPVTCAPP